MFGSAARKLIMLSTLIAPLATGCTATVYEEDVVYVRHRHNAVVFHDAPNLVYVGDGVYVVQDYGTAVYYVDGSYYYYDDGLWYSSSYWNSPWAVASIGFVPVHIHHRHHHQYVHYHGGHDAHVVKAPSHDQDHTASNPTHSGQQFNGHEGSEPSKSQTKGYVANVDSDRGVELATKKGNAPRDASNSGNKFSASDETRSSTKSSSPMSRAEPSRASTESPVSRPSDDDDGPSRAAPGKSVKPSKSAQSGAPRAATGSTNKAPSKATKKSKPTKKKSRR